MFPDMQHKLRLAIFLLLISSLAMAQSYSYHNEWIDYSKTYYKFKVMGFGNDNVGAPIRSGMVRIPYSTLAAAGLAGVFSEHLQLWRDGKEVPIYVSNPSGMLRNNDYIEFFGEINNGKLDRELYRNPDYQLSDTWSLQTDTAAYFLTVNTSSVNKRLNSVNNNLGQNSLRADQYFMYTVGRYFRNNLSDGFSASLGKNLYSSSYDKGEGWVSRAIRPVAGCGSATLPQSFANMYPYLQGPNMTLRVNMVGDAQNSRKVRLNINSDSIATYQMDYINYVKAENSIPVNKISAGSATFYIINQSPDGCDEMRTAKVELTYPRLFNFGGASVFNFTLDSSSKGRYLAITNFNYNGVAPVLYDIANGKRYVADISNADTVKVVLDPSTVPYNLVLTSQAGTYYKTISNLQTRKFINFSDPANQGNYLIISNPLIYGSGSTNYVEQYRQYRASTAGGSFDAKVIDINELVDQFAWGVKKHPLSIKNFLGFARNTFSDAPKYAFLIGRGVVYTDYRSNESSSLAELLNLVPTWGNPASDNLIASNDFTAIPATPIGRLSAISPQEVGDYLLKVKQYDSVQHSAIQTMDAKGWMKNVIQIAGANDLGLGSQLDSYLANYKKIISDTAFGANVISFSKSADPAGYPDAINSFTQTYEHGASLITYFGHSSNTSLDFNLDDPQHYNNLYKYPVFIADGCSAGNHFLFEPDRLNTKSTISEKFVLSPQRGAIGYIASTHFGVVNYLDLYTKYFYNALARTKYNQSIGAVLKEAIASSLNATGQNDFYSRVHAEQYAYHGDPAIMINATALPDYVIEQPQIQTTPSFISVADTSFQVKVKVNNIGRATKDAVTLKINRQTPDGQTFTLLTTTISSISLVDSVVVNVPVVGDRDKGMNKITASADYNNSIQELSDGNNSATLNVMISENEIRPVFPYKYAIITQPDIKLEASTVNPLNTSRDYIMELDTTALFNSSFKVTKTVTSTGGVVEFDPAITYQNGVTYYWRVASISSDPTHWVSSSFIYKDQPSTGFQQGHIYQNLESQLTRLSLDSIAHTYSYKSRLHNLFITNSIFPTSGTEDEHFSISVDGSNIIRSACVGHSVIFNVFDSLTFAPMQNLTQPFGAAPVCDVARQYNFEYEYTTSATRKNAINFIDAIPEGDYVAVRLILDQPYTTFASAWAADTALFGKSNSLYHRLKQSGFTGIDSFSYPRTWAFVFKKGDTTFTPVYTFSSGLYDRITLSVNCNTSNVQGFINSPVFGPAKAWNNVNWSGYSIENGSDQPLVNIYGIRNDKTDTLLYSLDDSKHTLNISGIKATQYPFIRLDMSNADSVNATPYQLTNWNIEYSPVPEGAIAPNLYFNISDSAGVSNTSKQGMMHVGVAFKNVSKVNFDSLSIKAVLYDPTGKAINFPVNKLRPLVAGDSLHVDLDLDVSNLSGNYNLYIAVNPDNSQAEQYSFNNFLYKYLFIDNGRVMPVTLLDFNAVLQNKKVKTLWSVAAEVNTKVYEVEHSTDGSAFKQIGTVTPYAASQVKDYSFDHLNPPFGKNYYRLKIVDFDGSYKYSPVRMINVSGTIAVNIYPNPVKDLLYISISREDGKPSDVRIINAFGQQLWQQKITGNAQVSTRKWAAGMYWVQVNEAGTVTTYKIQKQ
jgi:hypothetical protein